MHEAHRHDHDPVRVQPANDFLDVRRGPRDGPVRVVLVPQAIRLDGELPRDALADLPDVLLVPGPFPKVLDRSAVGGEEERGPGVPQVDPGSRRVAPDHVGVKLDVLRVPVPSRDLQRFDVPAHEGDGALHGVEGGDGGRASAQGVDREEDQLVDPVGPGPRHGLGDGWGGELHSVVAADVASPPAKARFEHSPLAAGLPVEGRAADRPVLLQEARGARLGEVETSGPDRLLRHLFSERTVRGEDLLQEGNDRLRRGIFRFSEVEQQDSRRHRTASEMSNSCTAFTTALTVSWSVSGSKP